MAFKLPITRVSNKSQRTNVDLSIKLTELPIVSVLIFLNENVSIPISVTESPIIISLNAVVLPNIVLSNAFTPFPLLNTSIDEQLLKQYTSKNVTVSGRIILCK